MSEKYTLYGYRWVVLALGVLSLGIGFGSLHMLMLGQDRLSIIRARAAAKAERKAALAEDEDDEEEEDDDEESEEEDAEPHDDDEGVGA